jgi:hypothetical protein
MRGLVLEYKITWRLERIFGRKQQHSVVLSTFIVTVWWPSEYIVPF